jgi:mono/diheme cytochrome c family protein
MHRQEPSHRFAKTASLAVLAILAGSAPVQAQSADAVQRGSAVVDTWCRLCHVRTKAEKSADTAPPFQEIVHRPGRDKAYLRAFLDEDHFPMTTFRLFDNEKDDVVDYLLNLKEKEQ